MTTQDLYEQAMRLPEDERAAFALRLLETVDEDGSGDICATPREWEEAWAHEMDARISALERGVAGVSPTKAFEATRR